MTKRFTIAASILAASAAVAATGATALASSGASATKPNIIVIMADDMAASDLQQMPNAQQLLVQQGTKFDNAVDSFPLCCPSRATFITGQYAHNHEVGANFWPYGWYGMKDKGNTLGKWLQNAGYTTAAIGKWLNGYGSGKGRQTGKDDSGVTRTINVKKGGEVPVGFNIWRGLLDVSAYDYFNFVMNTFGGKYGSSFGSKLRGKKVTGNPLNYWGDKDYANALVEFANIQITPGSKTPTQVYIAGQKLFELSKTAKKHSKGVHNAWYGSARQSDYSPFVTGQVTADIIKDERTSTKPFFTWWNPVSPHREDANGAVRNLGTGVRYDKAGKLVPDPRPPAKYDTLEKLMSGNPNWIDYTDFMKTKPNFNYADPVERTGSPYDVTAPTTNCSAQLAKPKGVSELPEITHSTNCWNSTTLDILEANYRSRIGALRAVDDRIKTIVDTLQATGQLNNTVIILTSDNGWQQGEHRITGDKFLPYEDSIKVPFVIRGPGIKANTTINRMVSNIDFAPTILGLAGGVPGRVQDGISLIGAAKGGDSGASALPDRAIGLEATAPLFTSEGFPNQWDQEYYGVRTQDWKYVEWAKSGLKELWDLKNDPYELHNLATQGTLAPGSVQAQMVGKMNALRACAGDACRNVSPLVAN